MIQIFIGLLIFLSAGFLTYATYDHYQGEIEWMTATPGKRIAIIVEHDFNQLAKERALPKEWESILRTTYKMNSPVAQALMGDERPKLRNNSTKSSSMIHKNQKVEDQFEAEIEVIDMPDEKTPGFILQISLIDLRSKNKVFEIGRTYYLADLNKKKPD